MQRQITPRTVPNLGTLGVHIGRLPRRDLVIVVTSPPRSAARLLARRRNGHGVARWGQTLHSVELVPLTTVARLQAGALGGAPPSA